MTHPYNYDDEDYRPSDAEMDAAADAAWGDRLAQGDAIITAADRRMRWSR